MTGFRALAALGALAITGAAEARDRYSASIVRTTYGIPHITARDWAGAGYGVGYAYAQDNLCMIAEEFATVAGERSLHFGPREKSTLGFDTVENLSSDTFFRAMIDLPALRRGLPKQDAASRALIAGYIAGYNRHLRDIGPAGVPAECRGKAWVRPIATDDMLRLNEKQMLLASSLALASAVASATPPGAKAAALLPGADPFAPREESVGSNGWAFGGDVTADKRGLLVGNPHFPWNGPSRFWQMHVTVPGKIDVMGASIAGAPIVTLGFNRDVAWTHTVTAAQHFTIHQLALDPADPTAYLVDGKREAMGRTVVSVPMPGGGAPVTRTLYTTRYGPIVANPLIGLGWTSKQVFALKDANRGNQRSLATWIAIGQARSVGDVRRAVEGTLGIPWVNTIAADRAGDALHADVTAVPGVSADRIKACATPLSTMLAGRATLLDGSRSECDWTALMPARDQAVLARRDYVANSNDSYWLTSPKAPYRALSPILGAAGTERSLRTRSGLVEIEGALAGGKRIDHDMAKTMAFANKTLAADLVVDRLVALCTGKADVAAACAVLGKWDRRFDVDSRGAYLFHAFWEAARAIPDRWAVKFDVADPVNTPRDFVTSGDTGGKLIAALKAAADRLTKEGIALDARWGDVQFAVRGGERIPIHGANGSMGVLNVQMADPVPGGLTPRHGTSYIQVVGFDAAGPVADAILSYSQSTDPTSPHFGDQTRAYAAKRWHRQPFTPAQIAQDGASKTVTIRE